MMSTTFCDAVVNEVRTILGEDYTVECREVPKNNCVLHGIAILRTGETVTPTIYLERLGDCENAVHAANRIIETWRENENSEEAIKAREAAKAFASIESWEYTKDKLRVRLYNRNGNDRLFENLVCREYLDLMAVLYIQLDIGTANVHTVLFGRWGVSEEDAFEIAYENMRKECMIKDLSDPYVLLSGEDNVVSFPLFEDGVTLPQTPGMYAITNKAMSFGASCILLPDALAKFGKGQDVVILPSSVHECLLFRASDMKDANYSDLTEMIQEINKGEVRPEDVLSDHPYLYVAAEGKIISVA